MKNEKDLPRAVNIKKIYPVLVTIGVLILLFFLGQLNMVTGIRVKMVFFSLLSLPFLGMGIYYHLQYRLERAKRIGRIEEREKQHKDKDTLFEWIYQGTEEKRLKSRMVTGYVVFGLLMYLVVNFLLFFLGGEVIPEDY